MDPPTPVLVVDDNPDIRGLLVLRLELDDRFGAVHQAASGEGALRVVRANPDISAVILDQQMPGGTGVDILPELRTTLPHARIVRYTSDDSVHDEAKRRGADEMIAKPSTVERVLDLLAVR